MSDRARLPLALLAPFQFVHPLLSAPYLSPPISYTLLTAQAEKMRWEGEITPLLNWLCAALFPSFPSVAALPPLDLTYHVTVSRKRFPQKMVPTATTVSSIGDPTTILQAPQRKYQM